MLYSIVKYFPDWLKHLHPEKSSIGDNQPWLAFVSIEFLKRVLSDEMKVFEYGSGGSTLFWASRTAEVVSVEHDKKWFDRMSAELTKRKISNVFYILAQAEEDPDYSNKNIANPEHYISLSNQFQGYKFEAYAKTIDTYEDHSFDVIIVDGRARPSCIRHSLPKLKKGGYLVVDNSERKYYLANFSFDKHKWRKWTFYGAVPYNLDFSETTIFKKLNE